MFCCDNRGFHCFQFISFPLISTRIHSRDVVEGYVLSVLQWMISLQIGHKALPLRLITSLFVEHVAPGGNISALKQILYYAVGINYMLLRNSYMCRRGPGSSVGIATELRARRSGNRIPVGVRFSVPVQTGPGAHPASCTRGTGSLPGVESGWGVTLTTHPLVVPWSWKGRAIPLLPL
jgi:hypothetical protein